MPKKSDLLEKLFSVRLPRSFTIHELDQLMSACNCKKDSGGRGSSVKYIHASDLRTLEFDAPHPQKELYKYQILKTRKFITDIKEDEGFGRNDAL